MNSLKYFSLFILSLLFTGLTNKSVAQLNMPNQENDWTKKIQWTFKLEKIDENHAIIVGTAKLKPHWHVFSVNHDPQKADLTGYPTKFTFKKSKDFSPEGKLQDGVKPMTVKDDLGTSLYFENKAVFKQKIKVLSNKPFNISFDYSFQICDEHGCIFPPDQTATVKVEGFNAEATAESKSVSEDEDTSLAVNAVKSNIPPSTKAETKVEDKTNTKEKLNPIKNSNNSSKGLLMIFIEGLIFGFFSLLTPCVFPMIPMTVSFFTKQSKTRRAGILKAFLYGFSIILIYVALGLIVTTIMGPSGLNELSTNVWVNLVFFTVFMIFAFSFLGAFEIRMPSSWVNKADANADKGGLIGVFFMAFTLSLVSFSCTGPIIGSSLVQAASSGSIVAPAISMLGFSIALALPFTLFAIFPGWLNSLPQSGGWLNSVKVIFGLIEIALALKFLSKVDLAYDWGILTREFFVAMWFVIFAIMGLYLLGKIRFAHDSPVETLSVTRFMFAFFALTFATYLLPGMWGAPLQLIDGFGPAPIYSEDGFRYNKGIEIGDIKGMIDPTYASYKQYMEDAGAVEVFVDLDIARKYAAEKNLPVLVDFTGKACENCRKTESTVWSNSSIQPLLQEKFVIVSLFCDLREELPESEWKYSDAIHGQIKTVGNKWSDYQIRKYGQISQPLYVIQDFNGNDLTEAIGYTPNIDEYRAFLEKGLAAFESKK